MRRFVKQIRDGNHKQLVEYLKKHGIEVIETYRPLDCLVFNPALGAGWMEVKTEARNAPVQLTQIKFMAFTKMPVAFVKTEDEALDFGRTLNGLSQKQKDSLAVFARTATKAQYHPAVVERVLGWGDEGETYE